MSVGRGEVGLYWVLYHKKEVEYSFGDGDLGVQHLAPYKSKFI